MKSLVIGLIACAVPACLMVLAVCVSAHITRRATPADAIVVPGAQVWPSGKPSNCLRYRLQTALTAYQSGMGRIIIVCGARGADEPRGEAEVMKEWLTQRGVPDEAVLREDLSVNTVSNLRNAKALMDARGMADCVLVTSDYHVTRALYIARRVGLSAQAIPAPSPHSPKVYIKNRVRESLSWLYYFVFWRP